MAKAGGDEKKYFRIGEVSRLTGVEPHVLRYWEQEFPEIRPKRVRNRRLYRKEDLELLRLIKELLHSQGFTIQGARRRLRELKREGPSPPSLLAEIRAELQRILELLQNEAGIVNK